MHFSNLQHFLEFLTLKMKFLKKEKPWNNVGPFFSLRPGVADSAWG
jgi:hypothetical protein